MVDEGARPRKRWDAYAQGLLAVYQIERGDQQTSGDQSRALVGTGLAYAAGAAALLAKGSSGGAHIDPILIMAAPLPLVALIPLLILGIGNIQQRAKYLVSLEAELEPYMSAIAHGSGRLYVLTVPNGFRRSEYVFARPGRSWIPDPEAGASKRARWIGSILMGAFTHGSMLLAELGLIYYAMSLLGGWHLLVAAVFYICSVLSQFVDWSVALRPGPWERSEPLRR